MKKGRKRKKRTKPTIGGDSEFGVVERIFNKPVSSSTYTMTDDDVVGYDGHDEITELRPHYSRSTTGFVKNLKSAIEKFANLNPSFYLTCGAHTREAFSRRRYINRRKHRRLIQKAHEHVDVLGGHVHVGLENAYDEAEMKKLFLKLDRQGRLYYLANGKQLDIDDHSLLNVSQLFTVLLLSLTPIYIAVEGDDGKMRRIREHHSGLGPYGQPDNFRFKYYGVEFRAPASNHHSPADAMAHYGMPLRMAEFFVRADDEVLEYIKNAQDFTHKYIVPRRVTPCHVNLLRNRLAVEFMVDNLISFPPFKMLRGEEKKFLQMARLGRVLPQKPQNIFKKWGIKQPPIVDSLKSNAVSSEHYVIKNKKLIRVKDKCVALYFY